MEFSKEEFDEIINIFSEESSEILQRLNNNLISLEKKPDNIDLINELFRDAHSLKGAARMIGFENIQNVTHKIEDILGLAKDSKFIFSTDVVNIILKALDFCEDCILKSIKSKKEVKSDKYTEIISMLQDIPKNKNLNSANNVEKVLVETCNIDFSIIISEIDIIFENLKILKSDLQNQNLLMLKENIDKIYFTFENTEFYEIKNLLSDIKFKLDFCIKTDSFLSEEEINGFKIILENIKEKICFKSFNNIKKSSNDKTNIIKKINEILELLNFYENSSQNIKNLSVKLQEFLDLIENNDVKDIVLNLINFINKLIAQDKQLNDVVISGIIEIINNISATLNENFKDKIDTTLILQNIKVLEQVFDMPSVNEKVVESPSIQRTKEIMNAFDRQIITTMRVHTSKLDYLINQVSEFIISKMETRNYLAKINKISNFIKDWKYLMQKNIKYMRYFDKKNIVDNSIDNQTLINFNKHLQKLIYENNTKLIELKMQVETMQTDVQEYSQRFENSISDFENLIKNIRILPLNTVFAMFSRMIRDLSLETGKQVELLIEGGDLEVDKKIIEEIKLPLMHILRNAIDHGIEAPSVRKIKNKNPKGIIHIKAEKVLNNVRIIIQDDGCGIDLEKVKNKAIEKGFLTDYEIQNMSEEQVMNVIFYPGFSTEDVITEISGRGVGLDVVRSKLSQLNGKIKVLSVLNQGTTIILDIPASMITLNAFIIEVDETKYAIDVNYVKIIFKIDVDKILTRENRQFIIYNNEKIPLYFLNEIFKKGSLSNTKSEVKILLLEYDEQKIAFIINDIIGHDELIHKELSAPLFKLKYISGATILSSGETCLILNISEIFNSVSNSPTSYFKPCEKLLLEDIRTKEHIIMLVDDSKTSRIMLDNILKRNNFKTILVSDPLDVIPLLENNTVDLIISDIEMPNLNGFELCKVVKTSERFKNIPFIVVSSLQKEEYSKLAHLAGADFYIQKTYFEQLSFLEKVKNLILNKEK